MTNRRCLFLSGILVAIATGVTCVVLYKADSKSLPDTDQPAGEVYSRTEAERDLLAVRTPAEEYVVFDRIARGKEVWFALFDEKGHQLGMSTSDWPNLAHTISFGQFGDP